MTEAHVNRNHAARWLLGLLLAALLIGSACTSDSKTQSSAPTATTSATAGPTLVPGDVITQDKVLEKDPSVTKRAEVVWGAMFEQTGPLAGFGEPSFDGLKMAVQDINEDGGFQVGDTIYTIRLVERDTQSNVSQSIAVATELIQDHDVNVIWGPASVGDSESTAITQRSEVLHLCPCPKRELTTLSSEEKVRTQSRWAFQTLSAPSKFLPPGARNTAAEHPEFDSFATICVNSETGHAFCDYFTDAYEAAGFDHVGEVFFPDGTTDFRPFLTNLKADDPDIILNFTDAGIDQFTLLRDSVALDVGRFYIAVALPYDLFESLVGGAGIRSKMVAAGAAPRNSAIYTSEDARAFFEDKYKPFKGSGLPPGSFAAMLTYDPAFMLLAAMQRAGTVEDTTKIAEALGEIHYSGYGEDDMYFDSRHLIVTGNDSCDIYQGRMTCEHIPPPPP
jgi:branched-chain amino acid transport system substrate-binding protein